MSLKPPDAATAAAAAREPLAALGARAGSTSCWPQGRPVFVDFTAAWCVTCQYNKKHHAGQRRCAGRLRRAARWRCCAPTGRGATRPSPPRWPRWAATACRCTCCTRPGRAPVVLSEILSVDEVRAALAAV
ncbi:MAG: thioredoxin family protein [Candidatus Nanopelagicales bacterium]